MKRVLVITDDRLGARMAGPAIRAYELTRHLPAGLTAELASLQAVEGDWEPGLPVHAGLTGVALVRLAMSFDILIAGGFVFAQHPRLLRLGKFTVLDLYDPMLLEELAREGSGALDRLLYAEHHRYLGEQMRAADFMICASERQRDYWLGRLCALGRLGPEAYERDPSARKLLSVVPFGLPTEPPSPAQRRVRGVVPGISEEDCVLIWGGGLWDWLDPLTPIRAVARLGAAGSCVRLVFAGGRSPNPTTPDMPMAAQARALATELGVLGTHVFFLDDWVPYAERGALLKEADAGFSAHVDHLETRFSFRTRILDYLWADLPVLTTSGDAMGELVRTQGLGAAIAPGDLDGWMAAISRMAGDRAWRAECVARVRAYAPRMSWAEAIGPLGEYCRAPYANPGPLASVNWVARGPFALGFKAALALKDGGWSNFVARASRYVGRRRKTDVRHG